MKMRIGPVILLVLTLSWTAIAQSPAPMRAGLWEISTKIVMPGMGEMPPNAHQQCVTADMIKDPQSAVPKMEGDCKISDYKLTAGAATYTVTCTQPAAITAIGEIKYAGTDAYTGTLKVDAAGMAISMAYDAKRVGECPK